MDGEILARDVFPAEVACPDGSVLRDVRVFATSHRVVAYGVREEGIVPLLNIELATPGSIPASHSSLTGSGRLEARTADGTYWVNRGRGCGCSGPTRVLKAYDWSSVK
jgi:hypothetical protein